MQDFDAIKRMRVVYQLPGMEQVPVRKGIIYESAGGENLAMDVYYPLDIQSGIPRPTMMLVHGGSQAVRIEGVNELGSYVSWAQLFAASGLVAVMFKHRVDEGFTRLEQAGKDVEKLIGYLRENALSLNIDADRLGMWTCSQGSIHGLRAALRGTPEYMRCIIVYYGGMSMLNRKYFHFSDEEEALAKEFSPVYHLQREDPARIAPLFIAKAGQDRPFLNEALDEFITIASERNIPITFMNHPTGMHGFDIFNDNHRSREIIKATLAFAQEHLTRP